LVEGQVGFPMGVRVSLAAQKIEIFQL